MRSVLFLTPKEIPVLTEIEASDDANGDPIARGWRRLAAAHLSFRIRVATALRQLDDLERTDDDEENP